MNQDEAAWQVYDRETGMRNHGCRDVFLAGRASVTVNATLLAALTELLRVDDEWHGAVNSSMASARLEDRRLIANAKDLS